MKPAVTLSSANEDGMRRFKLATLSIGLVLAAASCVPATDTAAEPNNEASGLGQRIAGTWLGSYQLDTPGAAPTAFIVRPGATSFADMLRDMKEGLVIEFMMGAEQGNVLGGDFSGNVLLGYKVEKGEIVGRVKNTMVSGNIYQLLKNITATGDRPEWVGGMLHTPHLYFPAVAVTTTA